MSRLVVRVVSMNGAHVLRDRGVEVSSTGTSSMRGSSQLYYPMNSYRRTHPSGSLETYGLS